CLSNCSRGPLDLRDRERSRARDIGVAPGVVADHVAVSEHPPVDRLTVRADLLTDLEEGRVNVLALEHAEELGRIGPWSVIERQRYLAAGARAAVHKPGPLRLAASRLRCVQAREGGEGWVLRCAGECVVGSARTGGRRGRGENLPP